MTALYIRKAQDGPVSLCYEKKKRVRCKMGIVQSKEAEQGAQSQSQSRR